MRTQGAQCRGIGQVRTTVEGLIIASCKRAGETQRVYEVLLKQRPLAPDLNVVA